ncbi:unnamed protein product [Paramecium pentaurelia]|uniref:C2H2-type domain-containing protein n=1 Tax=Paramecium pentaurelia TaxID=43138 RepID=A0A8S1W7V8_9CILI|nr:unnamed protein product [Paramecium pentaurelia]
MKQFQLASAIFLKEFLKIVDLQNFNIESIDERIEQLKIQILQNQQFNGFLKEEQNYNPQTKCEYPELENHIQQKTKKQHGNKVTSNGKQYFQCSKCTKIFNHPSSLSRHKKNQHKNIKHDRFRVQKLQTQQQQQDIVINFTDLQN